MIYTTLMNEQCVDRISELQEVEQKISQLLRESGLAIQSLSPGQTIQSRKESFETHAESFARLLEEVTVTLRKNIIALSKATKAGGGELSSLTVTAREKDAETWEQIREIVHKM